jgi:hypothetical protein
MGIVETKGFKGGANTEELIVGCNISATTCDKSLDEEAGACSGMLPQFKIR